MTRLAIAHDWLLNRRGAERVLKEFCLHLEIVEICTLFCRPELIDEAIRQHPIQASPLNRLPAVQRYYRFLLPWLPSGIRRLEIGRSDALLSISHAVAKGIPHPPSVPHICYCLTPARFLWAPELYGPVLGGLGRSSILRALAPRLKKWDLDANERVDAFVAVSETVRQRIRKVYGRESTVIYPCIDLDFFRPSEAGRQDFYLLVSGLVPQKRIDLAVDAFVRSGKPLLIVGEGPSKRRLAQRGASNICFLGWVPDSRLRELYQQARALIFPSLDEFGLVPVEAQACGCPVVAYGKGGATETVVEGSTGLFFADDTVESLNQAVRELERHGWDRQACLDNAGRFSRPRFLSEWSALFEKMGLKLPLRPELPALSSTAVRRAAK